MKWGRKASSPPSFGSSVITRVFPASWFSKFKQIGGTLETTNQQRGKLDFPTGNPLLPAARRHARFYSLDDDPYWTLSFRKDTGEAKRRNTSGRNRINPLSYDYDADFQVAVPSFKRELQVINEVDAKEINQEQFRKKGGNRGAQLKKENVSARRSRKQRSRVERRKKAGFDDGETESSNRKEEEAFPPEPEETSRVKEESQDSEVSNSRNHQDVSLQNFGPSSDEEIKVKAESQCRRSCGRKTKHNRKKAYAPRSECRIQALEEIKKARRKLNKETEEEATESSTISNSFAVVKSSFNPQQDFRDSMVEMIRVKGIRRREELQELLACYLTLNYDEHHDLIINAFQQVWFESTDSEKQCDE
ncbi:hypothetical protein C2S53_016364 [Perilla frutescens var. hirtella]|uniref:Transcription repressor n=1 Tax=Perilla frutescens var. hirtella TaxID=608512 RepID=A0AAD4J2S8_PERFH|nr:hypothetical protein C2S53_016364 [Perilla frutescens var. hirtella]